MAKRNFSLPRIQDLSKEQEAACALPKEGQHLIVGGPGTGKTVVTLLRGRRHRRDGDNCVFLVWNHLLQRSASQLENRLPTATWEKWFGDQFKKITGECLPRTEGSSNDYRPIDWSAVDRLTKKHEPIADSPYLVIDEGQDMPPQFYRALANLGFEHFFVAADQNQQITDAHSSRSNIETALAVETADVTELRHNYRNATPVAKLAAAFYTGDPASPPPEVPSNRPGDASWLVSYPDSRFQEIGRRIVKLVDRDAHMLVGVITPNNEVRQRYVDELSAVPPNALDHGLPKIKTFHGQNRPDVKFNEGGILVINAQACKGLEFDVAVLADIDSHCLPPNDPDRTRKLFYVMVARARKQVILLRRQSDGNRLDKILPDDPDVLRRDELDDRYMGNHNASQASDVRHGKRGEANRQGQEREGNRR